MLLKIVCGVSYVDADIQQSTCQSNQQLDISDFPNVSLPIVIVHLAYIFCSL